MISFRLRRFLQFEAFILQWIIRNYRITSISIDILSQSHQLIPFLAGSLFSPQYHGINGFRLETGCRITFQRRIDIKIGFSHILPVFVLPHHTYELFYNRRSRFQFFLLLPTGTQIYTDNHIRSHFLCHINRQIVQGAAIHQHLPFPFYRSKHARYRHAGTHRQWQRAR